MRGIIRSDSLGLELESQLTQEICATRGAAKVIAKMTSEPKQR